VHDKGFPTTYLLTYDDSTYSDYYKDRYREAIKNKFKIDLLNKQQETVDPIEAKKRLSEATRQVIVFIADGKLVKKHNIWYGFFRNLIGGSIFSMLFCIANAICYIFIIRDQVLLVSTIVLCIMFLIIFLFRKPIIVQNAEAYANKLVSEFMTVVGTT
jgi:hypothetical protein